jgi:hypothetical protein
MDYNTRAMVGLLHLASGQTFWDISRILGQAIKQTQELQRNFVNITQVLGKIQDYRRNWLQPINRMPRKNYRGKWKTTVQNRKNKGRPLKIDG